MSWSYHKHVLPVSGPNKRSSGKSFSECCKANMFCSVFLLSLIVVALLMICYCGANEEKIGNDLYVWSILNQSPL